MDPMFAVCIVIAVAGLSVALSLNAIAQAIRDQTRSSLDDMNTMSAVLRIRLDALTKVIKDK